MKKKIWNCHWPEKKHIKPRMSRLPIHNINDDDDKTKKIEFSQTFKTHKITLPMQEFFQEFFYEKLS